MIITKCAIDILNENRLNFSDKFVSFNIDFEVGTRL